MGHTHEQTYNYNYFLEIVEEKLRSWSLKSQNLSLNFDVYKNCFIKISKKLSKLSDRAGDFKFIFLFNIIFIHTYAKIIELIVRYSDYAITEKDI